MLTVKSCDKWLVNKLNNELNKWTNKPFKKIVIAVYQHLVLSNPKFMYLYIFRSSRRDMKKASFL